MSKFFVVSDIHSFYTPLQKALDEKGFDPKDENHWLVVCGDCYDRGHESNETLRFLMNLERKVIVRGNHDILLEDCCMREFYYSHDISNGTVRTINDLGGAGYGRSFDECCQVTWNKTARYRELLVNYFETQNYIFVHSWIPTISQRGMCQGYDESWREANFRRWDDAMWVNPFEMAEKGLNYTGKTIVFGHWHCSTGWAKAEDRSEFGDNARFDPYYGDKFIAIDACTAHSGQVNVVVIEDNFLED